MNDKGRKKVSVHSYRHTLDTIPNPIFEVNEDLFDSTKFAEIVARWLIQ